MGRLPKSDGLPENAAAGFRNARATKWDWAAAYSWSGRQSPLFCHGLQGFLEGSWVDVNFKLLTQAAGQFLRAQFRCGCGQFLQMLPDFGSQFMRFLWPALARQQTLQSLLLKLVLGLI